MKEFMKADFLIVGQGLAGSILALKLKKLGLKVIVIDKPNASSSSRVSQGMINPISGRRLKLTWNFDESYKNASHFYNSIEEQFSTKIFNKKESFRFFISKEQKDSFLKDKEDDSYAKHIKKHINKNDKDVCTYINNDLGGFLSAGAKLNVKKLLDIIKGYLQTEADLHLNDFEYSDLIINKNELLWKNINLEGVIFCEGSEYLKNPFFNWVPITPIKGQLIEIENKDLEKELNNKIIQKENFVVLDEESKNIWTGASFERKYTTTLPTDKIKEDSLLKLNEIIPQLQNTTVINHLAGFRPCSSDRKPTLGKHPNLKNIYLFNGFGSKGSLWIPHHADKLIKLILEGEELDKQIDISRFKKYYEINNKNC